jgi:hypothetical protein
MTPPFPGKNDVLAIFFTFLHWFILQSWRWRNNVSPKLRLRFNDLHGVMFQKRELFITTSCEDIIVFITKFLLATERLKARRLAWTDSPRCLSRLGLDHKKGKYLGHNPVPGNGRCFLFLPYRLANLTFQQFCWWPKDLKTNPPTAD